MSTPSYLNFNKDTYSWKPDIDYRAEPEKYHVGKGEQGVLICEPYKAELLPHWKFRTPDIAEQSSEKLFKMFLEYLQNDDFVGADMARKYLQMGFTRARRYTNYKGGKKYDPDNNFAEYEKGSGDPAKAKSAEIFKKQWKIAEEHPVYKSRKAQWKKQYG